MKEAKLQKIYLQKNFQYFLLSTSPTSKYNSKVLISQSILPFFHTSSQCTTLTSANTDTVMLGTCQSAGTCTANGGTADGNCASGTT